MNDLQLFDGISAENRAAMMSCFKPEQRSFRRGETIRIYAPELEQLCLLASGRAHLYCMDSDGESVLLENYEANDIFGEMFGGATIVETIFGIPGMGRLLVESVNKRDMNPVLGCVTVMAIGVALMSILTDVAFAFLDPRIRFDSSNKNA